MGQGLSRNARAVSKRISAIPQNSKTKMSPKTQSKAKDVTVDKKTPLGEPQQFYINPDAVEVTAGPWTGESRPDNDYVSSIQAKNDDLVRVMAEMPEIIVDQPKETVGSHKLHRSLPQDRSANLRQEDTELDLVAGKLNSFQVMELLQLYRSTPHQSPTAKHLAVEAMAEEFQIDASVARSIVSHFKVPVVQSRFPGKDKKG